MYVQNGFLVYRFSQDFDVLYLGVLFF